MSARENQTDAAKAGVLLFTQDQPAGEFYVAALEKETVAVEWVKTHSELQLRLERSDLPRPALLMVLASRYMRVQPRDLARLAQRLAIEHRRRCRPGDHQVHARPIARRLLHAAIAQPPAKAGAGALPRGQQRQGDRRRVPLLGRDRLRALAADGAQGQRGLQVGRGHGLSPLPGRVRSQPELTCFSVVRPSPPRSWRPPRRPGCQGCARPRAAASARSCTAPGSPRASGTRWSPARRSSGPPPAS